MAGNSWPPNLPDTLQDICLDFCVQNLYVLADFDGELLKGLKPGVSLPRVFCEGLLEAHRKHGGVIDDTILNLFADPLRTDLRSVKVSSISDNALRILSQHPIEGLEIPNGNILTETSVKTFNKLHKTLKVLKLGNILDELVINAIELDSSCTGYEQEFDDLPSTPAEQPHGPGQGDNCVQTGFMEKMRIYGRDYIFDFPNLRVLSLKDCHFGENGDDLLATILSPFKKLTHLDLTNCQNIYLEYMDCLEICPNLLSLILADVEISVLEIMTKTIGEIKTLRHLDLSQSFEMATLYDDANCSLKYLVEHLPELVSLDISGTNLAGFYNEPEVQHKLGSKAEEAETNKKALECGIPGLGDRQFEFLGLLGCPHNACKRKNIPATRITGDDSEEQILLSIEVYQDRSELLNKAVNNLFHLFRFSVVKQQYRAVEGILTGLKKHLYDKHIQISGSASLFYIVKGEEKDLINTKLKRRMIEALLDGMSQHMMEQTMMRNCCLTLCHFSIPQDVMFCYERLVCLLLKYLKPDIEEQDSFITRIGIYLLNCLACQVDGMEKKIVGQLGAVEVMLRIVRKKLLYGECDEIMEVAWSTLWNVTDETAKNCEMFMDLEGMDLFLGCLRKFPDKAELLRNMMGLMGNVAEVAYLRPRLMESDFIIKVFSDLLDSESDGIEVSYNAAGVLAHILSDGKAAWNPGLPRRPGILLRLTNAIKRWDINSRRNINYRSFEPILRLACSFETPEAQHWALWALCNLTKVYPEKYCELLEKENGLKVLKYIISRSRNDKDVVDLAKMVIENHRKSKPSKGDNSTYTTEREVTEPDSEEEEMDGLMDQQLMERLRWDG